MSMKKMKPNKQKKILVVDDEKNMRKFLRIELEYRKFTVILAKDGKEALMRAKAEMPDLIVLDVMMPKIDGYTVCRSLKSNEQYRSIPIILLTVQGRKRDIQKGLDALADAYITKPFISEELVEKINELIAS